MPNYIDYSGQPALTIQQMRISDLIKEARECAKRILDDSLYTWNESNDFSADALRLAEITMELARREGNV